jgi:DNA-binding NarL/FixJ family response regulator
MIRNLALPGAVPDILLIDVNMPQMDGAATAAYIREHYPAVKMVVLSMNSDDQTILKMLRMGCCAYLLKDIHPNELETAIFEIESKGFYNADAYNLNARRLLVQSQLEEQFRLTDRERRFLQLACSDLTYKQIAAEMFVSERTVDGYRDALFVKLKVQSRVGMALEALRRNLVTLQK